MFNEKEMKEVTDYIAEASEESRIYFGCDSRKYKKRIKGENAPVWFAKYTVVIAIHINGKNGCKVFGYDVVERDFGKNVKNPQYRLVQEVYKVCELYLAMSDYIEDQIIRDQVEIHLDLNPNKKWASQPVVKQGVGYVKGMTGIDAKVKPYAWVASYAADHKVRYGDFQSSSRGSRH